MIEKVISIIPIAVMWAVTKILEKNVRIARSPHRLLIVIGIWLSLTPLMMMISVWLVIPYVGMGILKMFESLQSILLDEGKKKLKTLRSALMRQKSWYDKYWKLDKNGFPKYDRDLVVKLIKNIPKEVELYGKLVMEVE